MAKITTKVELNEKELKEILADHYDLINDTTSSLHIHKSESDRGQGTYYTITLEGREKKE